ncbi:MAG: MFS transporter [Acidimicrobiales bacterium]|nr:MFS transporter [Acidimicrobiales bacterium]MXX43151.1 MFS transporter [Acidimicrobiales bacterium]MYB82086.1 MFS transporter [Acidimicrobiales bacterium]MYD34096.1 MFS transporter [Acidimicrobiales bacterium]MYI08165.1 MFS transporter [Acidimicrobiales bacterium]
MRHRPDRLFLLTGGVQGLAFSWGLPAMVWWVVDLRLSPFRLAVLGTALVLSILVTETPTGVVADLYSRKYSVVAAYVVMGTAMALGSVTELFGVLVIWQVLWGVGWTLQSGAATAWMTDELAHHASHSHRSAALMPIESPTSGEDARTEDSDIACTDRSRQVDGLIVRHAIFRSVGVMVGLVAATAMGAWSVRGSMAAMGLLAIAAAGYLAITMPEAGFESPRRRRHMRGARSVQRTSAWGDAVTLWKRGARLVRRNPSLLAVTLSATIAAGAWEANDRLSALRLFDLGLTQFDGREAVLFFGAAWFVMSALAIPMMMWLHRRLDQADQRSARRDAFLLARFLTIAAAGALALALSPWFTIALIGWAVLDVAGETAYSLTEAMANRQADSSVRATVVSFVGQSQAVGEVSIGLGLGVVAQLVSLPVALAIAAALFAVSAAPAAVVGWRTGEPED